jgi:hypothetical protein
MKVEMDDVYFANAVPLEQLKKAVGHAVRSAYMLSGMTDIAALRNDPELGAANDAIWQDTVSTNLYLHGGIGSGVGAAEGFGEAYFLPNTGYNETCAAVANCLWNERMFLYHEDGKYLDVLERALYNNVLSGISLSGDYFFYQNPLVSFGKYKRVPWYGVPCCPTNLTRFIPSMPGLIYAKGDGKIYVALYVAGTGKMTVNGSKVNLTQKTNYPWDGRVQITVQPEKTSTFDLSLRIPGWAQGHPVPGDLYRYLDPAASAPIVKVNGASIRVKIVKGFASIQRQWEAGDTVDLELPMPIRRVLANEKVQADAGLVALERGPVVYCVEGVDHDGNVDQLFLPNETALTPEFRPGLLGGVTVLKGRVQQKEGNPQAKTTEVLAVPYYAWDNRGTDAMKVWLPTSRSGAQTVISASYRFLNDGADEIVTNPTPANSGDGAVRRLTWWDHRGTSEWVQWKFDEAKDVSSLSVYWFDDGSNGACRVPGSWKLSYRDGKNWVPVSNASGFGVQKDQLNKVKFTPIKTDALRLDVQLKDGFSGGILQLKSE